MEKDPNGVIPIDEWRTDLWLQAMEDSSLTEMAKKAYQLWKLTRLESVVLSDEIKRMLLNLKESYKLLLLTNGDPQVQSEKLDHCSGWNYFESVMISGNFPYEKPEPAIFEEAFQRLHLKSDECIMVGDSLSADIQGGVNAGVLATVWINSSDEDVTDVQPKPDFKLDSVLKLHKVLDKLNSS
ncbi:putative N-acylneuraminate-9-phosphatase-like [Apostichopus japonicus]|uniref:Putative N-acylneuraminate-9-phosphatase-like n=1 Tax=Stichopus japonicus TaxID=307972 RepID=A0A2G8L562_STIJA|nr:putative N-acylneuraminate-9-phosphatase-like [Apostichopus japonicus]